MLCCGAFVKSLSRYLPPTKRGEPNIASRSNMAFCFTQPSWYVPLRLSKDGAHVSCFRWFSTNLSTILQVLRHQIHDRLRAESCKIYHGTIFHNQARPRGFSRFPRRPFSHTRASTWPHEWLSQYIRTDQQGLNGLACRILQELRGGKDVYARRRALQIMPMRDEKGVQTTSSVELRDGQSDGTTPRRFSCGSVVTSALGMRTPRLIAGANSSKQVAKAGVTVENVQIPRSDLSNSHPRQNAIRPPTDVFVVDGSLADVSQADINKIAGNDLTSDDPPWTAQSGTDLIWVGFPFTESQSLPQEVLCNVDTAGLATLKRYYWGHICIIGSILAWRHLFVMYHDTCRCGVRVIQISEVFATLNRLSNYCPGMSKVPLWNRNIDGVFVKIFSKHHKRIGAMTKDVPVCGPRWKLYDWREPYQIEQPAEELSCIEPNRALIEKHHLEASDDHSADTPPVRLGLKHQKDDRGCKRPLIAASQFACEAHATKFVVAGIQSSKKVSWINSEAPTKHGPEQAEKTEGESINKLENESCRAATAYAATADGGKPTSQIESMPECSERMSRYSTFRWANQWGSQATTTRNRRTESS
ncbi:hypothetical protein KCV07_g64, partial [Aureobasidium melanogenum]